MQTLMQIPQPFDVKVRARQKELPVNVVSLAKDFDIEVFETTKMTDAQSGVIGRREDGKTIIIVNAKHPATRKNFTIAHELGHFIAHGKELAEDQVPVTGIINDFDIAEFALRSEEGRPLTPAQRQMEAKANELAAEILMPEEMFRAAWEEFQNREDILEQVAGRFGVSPAAANVRASKVLGVYAV